MEPLNISKAMTREDRHVASRLVTEIRDLRIVPPPAFVAAQTVELGVATEGAPIAAGHYLKDDSGEWARWRADFAQRLIDKLWAKELARQDAIRRTDPERARREFDDMTTDGRREFTLGRVRTAIVTGTAEMGDVPDGPLDFEAKARENFTAMSDERRLLGTRLPDIRDKTVDTFFGLFIALAEKANLTDVAKSIREASSGVKLWIADFERGPWIRERNEQLAREGVPEQFHFIESGPGMGNMRGPYELFRGIRERADTAPMLAAQGYDWTSPTARKAAAELGPDAFPRREGAERWDPNRTRREESERQERNRAIGDLAHRAGPLGRIGFAIFDRATRDRASKREQHARNGTPEYEAAVSWERRSDVARPPLGTSPAKVEPRDQRKAAPPSAAVDRPPDDKEKLELRERQFSSALRGAVRTWATNGALSADQSEAEKARIEQTGERLYDWIGTLNSRQLAILHKNLVGGRAIETITEAEVKGDKGLYTAITAARVPELYRAVLAPDRAREGFPRFQRPSPGEEPRSLAEISPRPVVTRGEELVLTP